MTQQKGVYRPALRPPEPLDDIVAGILDDQQRRFEEKRLSQAEREKLLRLRRKEEEKKRKAKEKAAAQKANRVLTYLPASLRDAIEQIALKEQVSMAQVITFFLYEAAERYEANEMNFWGCKHRSESPRYEWILVHPKDTERMEKIASRKNEKNW